MKHLLLLLAIVALVAFAAPASAQFMYLDVNGDGVNTDADNGDVLTPSTTSVDVYLVTGFNENGSPASTANCGGGNFTINSYEVILRATGSLTYGTWTDNMSFATILGNAQAGADFYAGRGSGTILPPGTYKLGSVSLSNVAAGAVLSIVSSTSASPTAGTTFGSACVGNDFDNTLKLGSDWTDTNGTDSPTPVTSTTWGAIKSLYR